MQRGKKFRSCMSLTLHTASINRSVRNVTTQRPTLAFNLVRYNALNLMIFTF